MAKTNKNKKDTIIQEEEVDVNEKVEVEEVKTGLVIPNKLNFRKSPNVSTNNVIDILVKGTVVTIISEINDFYEVEINGVKGYCMKEFIQ